MAVCVTGFEWASKYGLLIEIIGASEYKKLTGIIYKDPPENDPPERFIVAGSNRRIYENFMAACFTRFGAIEAICENVREALRDRFYEQLEDEVMGYKEVTIMNYFDHLDEKWCKMDTRMRK